MIENNQQDVVEKISRQAKYFYSFGASGSLFFCVAVVELIWKVLGQLSSFFDHKLTALALAVILVYGFALVIPEPSNYPHAGKMRITFIEGFFGLLNTLYVFGIVLGLNCLTAK